MPAPFRPASASSENDLHKALALFLVCTAAAQPGLLLGASLAAWFATRRYKAWLLWAVAGLCLAPAIALSGDLFVAWLPRLFLGPALGRYPRMAVAPRIPGTVLVETLCGPLWLAMWRVALAGAADAPSAQLAGEEKAAERLAAVLRLPSGQPPQKSLFGRLLGHELRFQHPPGFIRLGWDDLTNAVVDVAFPAAVAHHVLCLGVTGSGKTTTIARLCDGALANGAPVLIVDAKSGGLEGVASELAQRHGVPYQPVVPGQSDSLGYNPCRLGTGADLANKIVPAFGYQGAAQVYEHLDMSAIASISEALIKCGDKVTLRALEQNLRPEAAQMLAARLKGIDPAAAAELEELAFQAASSRGLMNSSWTTLRARLGLLLKGAYGGVFAAEPELDLAAALAEPSVTYVGLPAMGSSAETALMAKVLLQDLKQVAHRRLRADVPQAVLVFEEFAALNDPAEVNDLLLQARESRLACCVSTQTLPAPGVLRNALLGAGLVIAHLCGSDDAGAFSDTLGTRPSWARTQQTGANSPSALGSIRQVETYRVHPNTLKALPVGLAVYALTRQGQHGLVRVFSRAG